MPSSNLSRFLEHWCFASSSGQLNVMENCLNFKVFCVGINCIDGQACREINGKDRWDPFLVIEHNMSVLIFELILH